MFHPLLMVTYGVVLALTFTYLAIYPPTMKLLLAGGTFLSTAVIPGAFIFMMVKNGAAVDLELSDRHERVVPYLIFITSIMVCAFYMYKMMLPFWFISLLLGACVALILALLINFFWKISAHAIHLINQILMFLLPLGLPCSNFIILFHKTVYIVTIA